MDIVPGLLFVHSVCTILTVSYEYHLFAYCNLFDISSNNIFFQAAQVMYEAFRAICADTTWDKGTWEEYLGKHVEVRIALQYAADVLAMHSSYILFCSCPRDRPQTVA